MKNLLFYIITILIWGSTWIGIKMQLGLIDPMVSVTYRFALAAVVLFGWCLLRNLKMRFSLREHLLMSLQGALLFGFNYLLFYMAELHVTSGLAAVIFSTILLMNMVNGAIFLRTPIDSRVVMGGLLGLAGIILVFRPEITTFSFENKGVLGIALCIVATLLASWGNITSAYNQKSNLPIVQTNAFGMGYGALLMFCTTIICQKSFAFDFSLVYVGSLLYLAIFGSVIAFGCYLTLVGSIGADRAAYATLLFPIVALVISTIWEEYQWTMSATTGVGLIVLGNLLMLQHRKRRQRLENTTAGKLLSRPLQLKKHDI